MSVLLCLLLVACVSLSMVVATSESNHDHDHVMIANHLTTAAAHSFRTLQISTAAAPTSSWFGPVKGVSDACKATSVSLETNSAIIAAQNSVIASGCTNPSTQLSCSTISRTCECIATYSNDANLRSLVVQAGGRVCSLDMHFTAYTSNGINIDISYRGFYGLAMVGSSCNNNDIQTMLSVYFDTLAEGIREGSAKSASSNKITSISGTMSFCGTTYTGTRQTNGTYNNNKPIGIIIIASLIGIIITIINQSL